MSESLKLYNKNEKRDNPLNLQPVFLPPIPDKPQAPLHSGLKSLAFSLVMASVAPQEGKTQEYITTSEDRRVAIEVMGESLVSQIEEVGFTIEVQTEATGGESYVIHIGQLHTAPGGAMDALMASGWVKSYQEKLDLVIEALARLGSGVVFLEGVAMNQDELEAERSAIQTFLQRVEELVTNKITSYEEITHAISIVRGYQSHLDHPFVANTVDREDIQFITEKITSAIDSFPEDTEENRALKETLEVDATLLSFRGALGVLSDVSGQNVLARHYILGDDVVIAATESADLNQQTLEALELSSEIDRAYRNQLYSVLETPEMISIRSRLDAYDREHLTADEIATKEQLKQQLLSLFREHERSIQQTPIYAALVEAEQAFEKFQAQRDRMVFEMIAAYEAEYGELGHKVVQYGNAHDFTSALAQYNLTYQDSGLGLIKLHAPE